MSVAFTTAFTRTLPQHGVRLRVVTARRPFRRCATASAAESAKVAITENNVMVFSKTTCPYCAAVKALFYDLKIDHAVWELDSRKDGDDVRQFLISETGQRTVPNVFIGGKHVGGCDDTMELHSQGGLLEMVNS